MEKTGEGEKKWRGTDGKRNDNGGRREEKQKGKIVGCVVSGLPESLPQGLIYGWSTVTVDNRGLIGRLIWRSGGIKENSKRG